MAALSASVRLVLGLFAIFVLFQSSAVRLGSDRGQASRKRSCFAASSSGACGRGRSFVRAASLATLPFAAVHLLMFLTMPWPVAAAALLLSLVLSFPLAALFELGGATIWPPAVVHFVVQGTVKVLSVSGESAAVFPLVWMAASAVLPLPVLFHPSLRLPHSVNENGVPIRQR